MICEVCLGAGWVLSHTPSPLVRVYIPCPDCGGTGRVHCCEGEQPANPAPRRHPLFDEEPPP